MAGQRKKDAGTIWNTGKKGAEGGRSSEDLMELLLELRIRLATLEARMSAYEDAYDEDNDAYDEDNDACDEDDPNAGTAYRNGVCEICQACCVLFRLLRS
jgi:hypothetical protein